MRAKHLRYHKYKGVTLIEALIAVTILSFLLAVIYQAYVPSMGHFKRVNDQTMTEQQALTAYQRMFRDLVSSNIGSVTTNNEHPTKFISFLSTDDIISTTNGPALTADDLNDNLGNVFTDFPWKKFVIVYPGSAMAGNRRVYTLLKKEVPYFNSSPENQRVLSIKRPKVNEIINSSAYPVYILARGITDIEFIETFPESPLNCITIELVSIQVSDRSRTGDQDFFESSKYEFKITPRN